MASEPKQEKLGRDLTQGPIFKNLLLFSLPLIAANVIQQLYSMVDLAVAGQFVGSIGTVGVNTGGEMADLVLPIAMSFSTGGQIFISQMMGTGDHSRLQKTISTLITFVSIVSLVLAVICIVFCVPILRLLNCPEEAMGQAEMYMIITALGYPFVFGYNAVCGILRAMGESKWPLYFIIIAASINIVADLVLVAAFGLEAAGTAIATVLSQIGSFGAAFYFLFHNRERLQLTFDREFVRMDFAILKTLVRLSIPQICRTMLVRVGMLWVNASINAYGTTVSATNGVGNKVQKFLEVFIQGMDSAASSTIGQNLGARKPERAARVVWYSCAISVTCAVIASIIGLLWPKEIFGLFSSDQLVLSVGVVYMEFMVIHFLSSALVGSFQSMVTGCGFVSFGFAIGILDGLVCKIGFSLIFVPLFENGGSSGIFAFFINQLPAAVTSDVSSFGFLGYFLGIACSRILPAILCICYFLSGKWRTRKLVVQQK